MAANGRLQEVCVPAPGSLRADGSVLIVDTGGWYKICCPTSQLAKPDVLGAIYRVRKTGMPKREDPRGLKLNWPALKPADFAKLLADERLYVRERATHELGKRGESAVSTLRDVLVGRGVLTAPVVRPNATERRAEDSAPYQATDARLAAVWSLARIPGPAARAADESLVLLEGLAGSSFDVAAALRKDKGLELDDLYYVGFHFAEDQHPLGQELLAEVVKKGFAVDATLWRWLEPRLDALAAGDPAALAGSVTRAIRAKAHR